MVDLKDCICLHCGTTPHSKECKRLHEIQHRFLDACNKLEYDGVRIVALLQRLIQLVDSGSLADPLTDEEIECARKLMEKLNEKN